MCFAADSRKVLHHSGSAIGVLIAHISKRLIAIFE